MTTEDTQKNIEEILRDIEGEPRAGGLAAPQPVEGADKDMPMTITKSREADPIPIYDTKTGERSIALRNMLRQILRIKRPDGSRVFTTVKPPFEPKRGTYKCMLHADDPNRGQYDMLGFPVCRKSNLTSPFMVKKHMKSRHKIEWAAIEEERKDTERAEDRKLQHTLIQSAVRANKPTKK